MVPARLVDRSGAYLIGSDDAAEGAQRRYGGAERAVVSAEPPAGLLLAAGAGRRYGMPKALVSRAGRLQVQWAAQALREGGCDPVVVVLGAGASEVLAQARLGDSPVVVNPDWALGMGSSLRSGLAALAATPARAAVVLLVDTPGITAAAVRRVAAHAAPDALVVATYHGARGHPVLLGRAHWPGVAELATGEVGARPYLAAHATQVTLVACEDVADGADVDHRPGTGGGGDHDGA